MDKPGLENFIKTLSPLPGVYRMIDKEGRIIYVGKAKNLKKRLSSYFFRAHESVKTRVMVNNISLIEVTVTETEADALLLESNLIKEFRPRYNIVFRDDKSYPYLYLDNDTKFPRLSFYRGSKSGSGKYFGPYPSAGASRRVLNIVQKIFKLRQCDDSYFNNRSRPCLQYQIDRCSAPCVNYIGEKDYAKDIELAGLFLEGKNETVIETIKTPMQEASVNLDFERAAIYRDQIALLRNFQESQHIIAEKGETDVIACYIRDAQACVQVFFIRGGLNLGNKTYFQSLKMEEKQEEILNTFLVQFYLGNHKQEIPDKICLSHKTEDLHLLEELLGARRGRPVRVLSNTRGEKARLVKMAMENARHSLKQRLVSNSRYADRLVELATFLGREETVERIDCFDISHLGGRDTIGACVVFGNNGPIKSDYRRFGLENITEGDDYQAMDQVVRRHYARIIRNEGRLPDIILLDGGKGQVSKIRATLEELQLENEISLMGIAKGPSRKAGKETLVLSSENKVIKLQEDSKMLHLLQEIRDEAHRFAITGNRQRRKKKIGKSSLESIDGIGKKRRQQLILHFGGMQGILKAGADEISRVPGISDKLARKIYDRLHS